MSVLFWTSTTKIAESWFVVGPGCNKTIDGLGLTKTIFLVKKGLFMELERGKDSFQGVWDLIVVDLAWRRRIVIWRVDCACIKAMVPPNLLG